MEFFLWEIKDFLCDCIYAIGRFFKYIFVSIFQMFVLAFETARYILYRILCVILALTNIGFLVGIYFLICNIRETLNGVSFTDTSKFTAMIILFVCHIVMFMLCKLVRPKD